MKKTIALISMILVMSFLVIIPAHSAGMVVKESTLKLVYSSEENTISVITDTNYLVQKITAKIGNNNRLYISGTRNDYQKFVTALDGLILNYYYNPHFLMAMPHYTPSVNITGGSYAISIFLDRNLVSFWPLTHKAVTADGTTYAFPDTTDENWPLSPLYFGLDDESNTYAVPLRFFLNNFNFKTDWDTTSQTVTVVYGAYNK